MRLVYWTLGLSALLILVAGSAAATHYRYGTLSWAPTENPNEVVFTGGQAWRASAFGSPAVGQVVRGEGCIDTGDDGCEPIYLKVNARSEVNDYFSATFVDALGNEGIRHAYPAPNNGGAPWSVEWASCCRISSSSSGNAHINNPDQSESLQTYVDLASANSAPRSTLPPINACPREALCQIPIPATDAESDAIAFRLSSASEAGDPAYVPPGPPYATNAATIDAQSGILSWDTRGALVSGTPAEHTLYSVQVMLEDSLTQTPLDFFIEILPVDASPPYWVSPPTPCGQTIAAPVGASLAFDVVARSDDAARIVRVSHLGLPPGAAFPPVAPGNPASGVFSWTPTAAQVGSYLVVFAAEDDLGYPAPACPVTLQVGFGDPPAFSSPVACGVAGLVRGVEGYPISFPVTAYSPNASLDVTVALVSGPAGLAFPTAGPSNPAGGVASWPAAYVGAPPAVFRATDTLGVSVTCVVPFRISAPMGQATTLAAWAGTAVPVSAEYSSWGEDVRATSASAPMRTRRLATLDVPEAGLRAEGVTEWAGVAMADGVVVSTAGNRIETATLANGLVVLHGLEQEVTVTWNAATNATIIARDAQVARVVVNGIDVPVAPGAPLVLPLPGGYVRLFEQGAAPAGVADSLLHVYATGALGRHEVILGGVIAQAGADLAWQRQARSIVGHDDLRSGADAGSGRAGAMALPPGAYDANMPPGDAADAFAFPAKHGEKIVFVAQPAVVAYARGGEARGGSPPSMPTLPETSASPGELWRASLYDPTGALREESLLLPAGLPARVELNADLDGDWLVVVERASGAVGRNYTLALSVTPLALLPQNDALSGADAAPACVVGGAGIPLVSTGVWPGVVRDEDFEDTYRFTAQIGEIVTVALKPGEDADGVDMALELYDRDCVRLMASDGIVGEPKGEAELTFSLPSLYSGDYYLRVLRVNGVGNHYVEVNVVNPLPTAPRNDALTGADAPSDPAQASAPPPGAFQGRLEEGDAGDAYRLDLVAGRDTFVAFHMSALSQAQVALYAPDGARIAPSQAFGSTAVAWRFDAPTAGAYTLVVRPMVAGGNYAVTWGQAPAEA